MSLNNNQNEEINKINEENNIKEEEKKIEEPIIQNNDIITESQIQSDVNEISDNFDIDKNNIIEEDKKNNIEKDENVINTDNHVESEQKNVINLDINNINIITTTENSINLLENITQIIPKPFMTSIDIIKKNYCMYDLDNCFEVFKLKNGNYYIVYPLLHSFLCFDLTDEKIICIIKDAHSFYVLNFRYIYDSFSKRDLLQTISGEDNNIKLWNIETWECVVDINANRYGIMFSSCFIYDDLEKQNYMVSSNCTGNNYIQIFDLKGKKIKDVPYQEKKEKNLSDGGNNSINNENSDNDNINNNDEDNNNSENNSSEDNNINNDDEENHENNNSFNNIENNNDEKNNEDINNIFNENNNDINNNDEINENKNDIQNDNLNKYSNDINIINEFNNNEEKEIKNKENNIIKEEKEIVNKENEMIYKDIYFIDKGSTYCNGDNNLINNNIFINSEKKTEDINTKPFINININKNVDFEEKNDFDIKNDNSNNQLKDNNQNIINNEIEYNDEEFKDENKININEEEENIDNIQNLNDDLINNSNEENNINEIKEDDNKEDNEINEQNDNNNIEEEQDQNNNINNDNNEDNHNNEIIIENHNNNNRPKISDIYLIETFFDKKIKTSYIIACCSDSVKSFNYNTNSLYRIYQENLKENHIHGNVIIDDNENNDFVRLIETCNDGYVRIWDFHSAELLNKIRICDEGIKSICLWDENHLFVGCDDATIKLVDMNSNEIIHVLNGHKQKVCCLKKIEHEKYGKCLISKGWGGDFIKLWKKE